MSYQSRASPPYLSSLGHWETRAQTPSLASSCISTESREQGREAKRMREQRLINDSDSKQHASPLWSLLLASAAPVTLLFSVSVGNKTLWQSVFLVSTRQHTERENIFDPNFCDHSLAQGVRRRDRPGLAAMAWGMMKWTRSFIFSLFPCSWLSFYQHCLNTVWLTENSVSKYWHNVKISHLLFAEIDNNRSFLKLVTEIKQSSKTPISFQARKKQLELAASQGGMWCRSEAVRGPEVTSRPSAPHCGHSENLTSDPRHPNTGPWPGDIRPGHASLWKS